MLKEEELNSITHGAGLLLSSLGLYEMLRINLGWDCIIYGITLFLVYLASVLSHLISEGKLRELFTKLDQIFIFFLIAGTFTPLACAKLDNYWHMLVVVWGLALFGATTRLFKTTNIGSQLYLLTAFLPAFSFPDILKVLPLRSSVCVILGALFYGVGIYFWSLDYKKKYYHAIWHIMVIFGSLFHYVAIFRMNQ